jgi:phage terminase large subunit-like protein
VWVSARSAYFNMEAWADCADPVLSMEDFEGSECLMCLDLASKTDICARVNLFYRMIDGVLHYYSIAPRFYLPEETIQYGKERAVIDRYQKWLNQGVLTGHDGAEVSFNQVRDELVYDAKRVALTEIPHDEWGAFQIAQDFEAQGYTPVKIPKTTKTFSPAMKELNGAILSGRFHHDGNPILSWMMGNVTARPDANENVFPRKEKNASKIDGAVALLMGINRAMLHAGSDSNESFMDAIRNPIIG